LRNLGIGKLVSLNYRWLLAVLSMRSNNIDFLYHTHKITTPLFLIPQFLNPSIPQFRRLVVILIGVLFVCTPAIAAEAPDFFTQDSSDEPWHIKADNLSYDKKNNLYVAKGNVRLIRGNRTLTADTVYVNRTTNIADASGEVVMTVDADILTGSRIVMNMKTEVGVIYEGKIFIAANHFYIRGNKIIKTGKETYYIDDCSFTTCDGDSPDWKITGKDLNITIDGYGTIKHAAFYTKSIPLLYTPYLVFPVKLKRQTGFLPPLLSYSERDGFEYNLPFFWAINESSDATYYQNGMLDHRGIKHGVEYRYALGQESKGTVMYDFLYDRQIDRGEAFDDPDGYTYKGYRGDDELRLNRKRWWFRTKNDQYLGGGVRAKLDIDVVSDQDYLREFKDGYSGFNDTDRYYLMTFGRDIDDYTDTVRTNRLTVDKNWSRYSLNSEVLWYDNVIVRNQDSSDDTTLQQLPSVTFTGVKQVIGDTPLFFDLSSYYKHSWRREGTRGHSVDVYPRSYYPVRFYNYFNFEPSVGLRETSWVAERYSTDEASKEKQRSREIYDIKGDLSTEFGRIFHIGGDRVDKIKHSVRPQVVYSYIPELDQENLPSFVSAIAEENLLTYSITNTFTSRLLEKADPDATQYRYHDFCRLKLSQIYDIKEARRDVEETPDQGDRRPFSDVTAELEFNPWRYISLDADVAWCPYDGEYKSYNTALRLSDYREDRITVEYRYTQEDSENGIAGGESIYTEAFLKIYGGLSAYWQNERNLYANEDIRSVVGCFYESQCWAVGLTYSDEEEGEREYMFTVSLRGLSEFEFGVGGMEF
jgi:LPS-assembly protein